MWTALGRLLETDHATPFAGAIIAAARRRLPEPGQLQRMLQVLDAHPRCSVRAAALSLHLAAARDDARRAATARQARFALDSSCWRLNATARSVLRKLGIAAEAGSALPSFLAAD